MKLSVLLVLFPLFAFAAFEDGEKILVEGPVPAHVKGAYRPYLLPGVITEADGVTEYRLGHGLKVWFPPTLAPAKLAELKRVMALPMKPIGSCTVGYIGDGKGREILDSLGVDYHAYGAKDWKGLGLNQVLVLGPGVKKLFGDDAKALEGLRGQIVSRAYLIVLPGAELDLLPYGLGRVKTAAEPKGAVLPDLPVFLGTRKDYADFLAAAAGTEFPAMTGGPAWIAPSSPAYFTHLKHLGRTVLILNVAPGDVAAAARDPLTRLWCTMLANINVYTR